MSEGSVVTVVPDIAISQNRSCGLSVRISSSIFQKPFPMFFTLWLSSTVANAQWNRLTVSISVYLSRFRWEVYLCCSCTGGECLFHDCQAVRSHIKASTLIHPWWIDLPLCAVLAVNLGADVFHLEVDVLGRIFKDVSDMEFIVAE